MPFSFSGKAPPPENSAEETPPPKTHGGARKNSGRTAEGKKGVYTKAAVNITKKINRFAVAAGGPDWQMDEEDGDAISEAFRQILERWEVQGINNPYAALVVAGAFYGFAPGRWSPKTAGAAAKNWWGERRAEKARKKAEAKAEAERENAEKV